MASQLHSLRLAAVILGWLCCLPVPVHADPARCDGQKFNLVTAPQGLSPYVRLEAGGRSGLFQLDYGATRSSLQADFANDRVNGGGVATVAGFSLPTFTSGRFDVANFHGAHKPAVGQMGIVGTDFLSLLTADFSFSGGGGDVVLGPAPCDRGVLQRRGLIGIGQIRYFSSDLSRVAKGRPNVPVLPLDIGGIATVAQIDTGYDDRVLRPSIDINEALFQRLLAAGLPLKRSRDIGVATCEGSETREVYTLPAGVVAITTSTGVVVRELPDAKLVRKLVNGCGGIADMREPAAQLGMSAVAMLGTIVFDPKSEMVWVGGAHRDR